MPRITDITVQVRNPDRVNVSVDGKYRFSLDIYQVGELGIKNGREVTPEELTKWEEESTFGKLYGRALEYVLMRPHSAKEVRDYLWRKTRTRRIKIEDRRPKTEGGFVQPVFVEKPGVSQDIADRVLTRLVEKGYVDDEKFARFWVENRQQSKGISRRKLEAELRAKGVPGEIIAEAMQNTSRDEKSELQKVIDKKRHKYPDEQKLVAYLSRQGFSYEDIREGLEGEQR